MEQTSSQQARNLRALAMQLRQSAFETDDEVYVELFLRAARELEDRIYDDVGGSSRFLN